MKAKKRIICSLIVCGLFFSSANSLIFCSAPSSFDEEMLGESKISPLTFSKQPGATLLQTVPKCKELVADVPEEKTFPIQQILKSLPLDFTTLEEINFFEGGGTIQPDRVYKNEQGERVAYFSREKCLELQPLLKNAVEKIYSDNSVFLYGSWPSIEHDMNATVETVFTPSFGFFSFKIFAKNLFSSHFILGGFFTNQIAFLKRIFGDGKMSKSLSYKIGQCVGTNTVVESREHSWQSTDGRFHYGIAISLDHNSEYSFCRFGDLDDLVFHPIRTFDDVFTNLKMVKALFSEANIHNDDCLRNIASARLTEISRVFTQNFERPMRFTLKNDLTLSELQEVANILAIRRFINNLVLSYRLMYFNINLCNSGDVPCLTITSPAGTEKYYFGKIDANTLTDNIELAVATEINRYLNQCVVSKVTEDFIKEALKKHGKEVERVSEERMEKEKELKRLGVSIDQAMQDIARSSASAITNECEDVPNVFENTTRFMDMCALQEEATEVRGKISELKKRLIKCNLFRESIFLHFQLEYIRKYFPNFSGIIVTEHTVSDTEKKYTVQFLR